MASDGADRAVETGGALGPGGVGDGLPALPTGEPVLARWFVLLLLVLVPLGVALIAFALLGTSKAPIAPELRRPPGTAAFTHDRGDAVLPRDQTGEPGPTCASGVTVLGDENARTTARAALRELCVRAPDADDSPTRNGLARLSETGGSLRFAVFELTGVESSTRVEDGAPVIELNAKYQYTTASHVVPVLAHELAHVAEGLPGEARVSASAELRAVREQASLCLSIDQPDAPPRGCLDADDLLALDDPEQALVDAGYPPG